MSGVPKVCHFSHCAIMVNPEEGVRVAFAGWRMRFCCHIHAAWWLEDWALKMNRPETIRALALADPRRRAGYEKGGPE